MNATSHLTLEEIEPQVCEIIAEITGRDLEEVRPESRLLEDLDCDSIDFLDLVFRLERHFSFSFRPDAEDPVGKSLFTRSPFCVADVVELVYLRQGTSSAPRQAAPPERSTRARLWPFSSRSKGDQTRATDQHTTPRAAFTQLGGCWRNPGQGAKWLLEPIEGSSGNPARYRRRSDGMLCVKIPGDSVAIGGNGSERPEDEQPEHVVDIDDFLIDAEPVSTTAYCRFLNSIDETAPETLRDWFVLDSRDDRQSHLPIAQSPTGWRPASGAEFWPMMLVSWYGATAYSLWANGFDWNLYREQTDYEAPCFLPSEAQWEYAARGSNSKRGFHNDGAAGEAPQAGYHLPGRHYRLDELPFAGVHEPLGVSPFGINHMGGNVWNWCRDWYDPTFYQRAESRRANPLNGTPTGIRSERGGSWVGPAALCQSSYRRGRPPLARGRCLGFRCVSSLKDRP